MISFVYGLVLGLVLVFVMVFAVPTAVPGESLPQLCCDVLFESLKGCSIIASCLFLVPFVSVPFVVCVLLYFALRSCVFLVLLQGFLLLGCLLATGDPPETTMAPGSPRNPHT